MLRSVQLALISSPICRLARKRKRSCHDRRRRCRERQRANVQSEGNSTGTYRISSCLGRYATRRQVDMTALGLARPQSLAPVPQPHLTPRLLLISKSHSSRRRQNMGAVFPRPAQGNRHAVPGEEVPPESYALTDRTVTLRCLVSISTCPSWGRAARAGGGSVLVWPRRAGAAGFCPGHNAI